MVSVLATNRIYSNNPLPAFVLLAGAFFAFDVPAVFPQSTSLFDANRLTKPVVPELKNQLTPEARGDVFMARKMYRDAIESYRLSPADSPLTWNKIGIAYHQLLELNTAEKQYQHALKLDPKYSEAINNLGTIYYSKKKYRAAINRYKAAIRIKPESASYYSNLGTAYFAQKKYQLAAAAYQTAVKLDPDVFENHSTFGTTLQERSVSEFARFHFELAKTYAKSGQNERALLYIRKSLEEGFKDRKLYMEEPEFADLRATQEFKELMALEPRVL